MIDPMEAIFQSLDEPEIPDGMEYMLVTSKEKHLILCQREHNLKHRQHRKTKKERRQERLRPINKNKKANQMRSNPTEAERNLWKALGAAGIQANSQRVMLGYIADFYVPAYRLVIEADGGYHLMQKEKDDFRDHVFRSNGFFVMRFTNEIILNNISAVIADIKAECARIATMEYKESRNRVYVQPPKAAKIGIIYQQSMKPRRARIPHPEPINTDSPKDL